MLYVALPDESVGQPGRIAQACRMQWTVEDDMGKVVLKDKYVLSLKDLNLSAHLSELVEAGIDSFMIEGRLKEADYVAKCHELLFRSSG